MFCWYMPIRKSRSLNGSIRDFMVDRFVRAGHTVEVSDLYAMRWKAGLDADDFPQRDAENASFFPAEASPAGAPVDEMCR